MDAQRTLSIGPWIIIVLYYLCYLGQCIDGPALFRRMSKLLGSNHVAFSSLGFPVSTGIISHSWSHWAACTVIQENRGNVWNSQNQRRSRAVCGIVIGTGCVPCARQCGTGEPSSWWEASRDAIIIVHAHISVTNLRRRYFSLKQS